MKVWSLGGNGVRAAALALTFFALACIMLISGCSENSGNLSAIPATGVQDFTLTVHESSYIDAGYADEVRLELEPGATETMVRVRVDGARGLKALYAALSYDPALYTPVAVDTGSLLGTAGETLALSDSSTAGVVELGQVLTNWEGRDGAAGNGTVATVTFRHEPYRTTSQHRASVPDTNFSIAPLSYDRTTGKLSWLYANQGDYNQDSIVSLADLTALSQHFNTTVPNDPESGRTLVDGNGDGVISLSDTTMIAQNIRKAAGSYRVYASHDPNDYPQTNTDDNGGAVQLGTVTFGNATQAEAGRKQFSFALNGVSRDTYCWVRPSDGVSEGTPSSLVTILGPPAASWQTDLAELPAGLVLGSVDYAPVDGKPAFCWTTWTAGSGAASVQYRQSADGAGINWLSSQQLAQLPGNGIGATAAVLEVNGRAAVAYGQDALYFRRATEANATAWGEPVEIAPRTPELNGLELALAAGYPAVIAAYNDTMPAVASIRADNLSGSAWTPPVLVDAEPGAAAAAWWRPALGWLNGRPLVAYSRALDAGGAGPVNTARGTDGTATSWQTPETVTAASGPTTAHTVAGIGSRTAVAFIEHGTGGAVPRLVVSRNDGNGWGTSINLPGLEGSVPQALELLSIGTGSTDGTGYGMLAVGCAVSAGTDVTLQVFAAATDDTGAELSPAYRFPVAGELVDLQAEVLRWDESFNPARALIRVVVVTVAADASLEARAYDLWLGGGRIDLPTGHSGTAILH